jgi:hypothetical protein
MFSLTIKVDFDPIDKNGNTVAIDTYDIVPYVVQVIEQPLREADLIGWAKPLARIDRIGVAANSRIGFIDRIKIGDTHITGPDGFRFVGS